MSPAVKVDTRSESVVQLTLNRPDKRNALSRELVEELTRRFEDAGRDSAVRVVVLTGAGTAFCAGADLDELRRMQSATREDNERDSQALARLLETIVRLPKAVIARVNGHAIAGGCGLVAACDFAIAADSAKFGFTEVRIGFVPAIVSTILVRKLAGFQVRRLFLSGDLITSHEAFSIGLLSQSVAVTDLDSAVDVLAHRLATRTSGEAIALTKELLIETAELPFGEAISYASDVNVRARASADCREGVAAFLEKRDPSWRSRGDK